MSMQNAKLSQSMDSAFLLLLQWIVCFLCVVGRGSQAQGQGITDPVEVSAFRSISKHWNLPPSISWNSTEPCSGTAIDSSTIDDRRYDPAIKCSCNNGTCHITQMKVSGRIKAIIPEALAKLTSLTNLILSQNYLTGPLPAFIGNLTSMQYLSFGINALSGTIPKELGNLERLISLAFGSNNFSGPLPPELGKLVNLQQLYIDSAGLSGPIPSSFINLKNMQILWASDNQFTGKIPDLLCNLTELTELRLEGSFSQGPIPSGFSNLTSLSTLRISDLSNGTSSLSFIKNMKSLNTLVLRNVRLFGSIPTDIWSYQELKHLDLSFNDLSGQIPDSLFNMNSLSKLYLGSNLLSGLVPSTKSLQLLNIDLSYNNLSGGLPSWLGEKKLQINLVGNYFVIDSSNNSGLPAGLRCLQRDFSCNRNPPIYSSFAIKCGGPQITSSNGIMFDRDDEDLGASSYYMIDTERWAVSNNGNFLVDNNPNFTQNSSSEFTNTLDSKLFQTARVSPVSLRYYGLGLENGNYTVNLLFAETAFLNSPTWQSVGRRIFDIYVQGTLVLKDFDMRRQAGGLSFRAVSLNFTADVSDSFLEIHLYWAGKGTCCIPVPGTYGPSISAISVTPDFVPTVRNCPRGMCSRKKKAMSAIIGISVAAAVVAITSLLVVFILRQRKRRLLLQNANAELLGTGVKPNMFSFAELQVATNGFNAANKLGEGGFGPVYKGELRGGQEVAIKRLSRGSKQGLEEFTNEVKLIAKLQHVNLVQLLGCCAEGEEQILVYEYMPNKSLDHFLFGPTESKRLDWEKRLEIMNGIARGLQYLHQESRLKVIHRDLKTSNILLDNAMNPRISDFGLARIFGDEQTHISTKKVAGTCGYMPPEYAMEGHYSTKSDVFSFGVIVLEIVSGLRMTSFRNEEYSLNLLGHAWKLWNEDKVPELLDPSLGTPQELDQVLKCVNVGLLCVQENAGERPTMSSIVFMLGHDSPNLASPKKPAYSHKAWSPDGGSTPVENELGNPSTNDLTVSMLQPR